jgi:IMP dehydrogenase
MKALSFDDISLVPRYNNIASRKDVDTSVQFGDFKLHIPIFSANMDTVTGVTMARKMYNLGGFGFLHRFCSIEDNVIMYDKATRHQKDESVPRLIQDCKRFESVVSLGVNEGLDRFHALYEVGARYFCVDVAHGHSKLVGHMITAMKEVDSSVHITAGNVCHATGAEYLADKGADAIKVGIGPGSVCSTRIKTGFGVPQFTAIRECRRANVFLIADGGIRTPGDAVKAFAAGADAVMLGGMLAGTDETPGEVIEEMKVFRGMASKEAADDFLGGLTEWKTAEGIEIKIEAKGPVANIISDLLGGIRSGMTYCGANSIEQIRHRAEWVEITAAGRQEGTPHAAGK